MNDVIRWGMIGCGDVAEVKSGPALQKADGSALVGVMRRDRAKAEDFAGRHGVPRVHTTADEHRVSAESFLAIASPVPEASTWAMLIIGFAGIGLIAYRREAMQSPMVA